MAGGMWTLLTVGSIIFFTRTGAITLQNRHILRYEPLHYSRDELHRRHIISTAGADLHLTIKAYGRSFRLRLQRDTSQFTEEFQVMQGRQLIKPDLSFIYTGEIIGIDQSHHILVLDSEVEGRPLDIVELLCKLSGFFKPSMGRADKNWPEHFYSRGGILEDYGP